MAALERMERRGRRESTESQRAGGTVAGPQGGPPWAVFPEGFQVADEPAELDDSLIGSSIYMRWEEHGWQAGQDHGHPIYKRHPPPRQEIQIYRIMWADGQKGPAKLAVANYGYGTHAAYHSWVILHVQQKT